jgi:ABC-2 type transport system ATP-binding protein
MYLFTASNIVKRYADHLALDHVTVNVPEGSVYGLLGPNGAGKTTLLRIINQISGPDEGELLFHGRRFEHSDIKNIGYLPEERGLYKKMKVGEQALYLAQLKGMSKAEAMDQLKKWFIKFEIQAWWNKKVEELSKGMQQKVQFITTIIHKPKLLIFDEPFSGFDPINANLLKNELLELKKNGSTIIFSTHDMGSVEELCDYITLINKSKTLLEGAVHDIKMTYKTNSFEIGFKGNPAAVMEALDGHCTVIDQSEEMDHHKLRVKAENNFNGNDMLSRILPVASLNSFNEIIPTMNEIFINVVEAQNKQNPAKHE